MIEIGLKLKEKREENGVSIEEVAEDLKMRPSQIISLEEGKKDDFKDVVFLKYFIRDYAKYLGLDGEELVDEFNEFLFDFTSICLMFLGLGSLLIKQLRSFSFA